MPELPDLAVVVDAFHAALAGRSIVRAEAPAPLAVRGTPAELAALVGQRLIAVRRRGKFVLFQLDRDTIVVNAMLTGRFQLSAPEARRPANTAVVLGFSGRKGVPPDAAPWTRVATWLPPDRQAIEVRYRDPSQMGKVYLVPGGTERPIPGLDPDQGPDADSPELTLERWDPLRSTPNVEPVAEALDRGFVAFGKPRPILLFLARLFREGYIPVPIEVVEGPAHVAVFVYPNTSAESASHYAGAKTALGHAYGGGAQYFAMWIVSSEL